MKQTKLDKKIMSQFDLFSSGEHREDIYYWNGKIIWSIFGWFFSSSSSMFEVESLIHAFSSELSFGIIRHRVSSVDRGSVRGSIIYSTKTLFVSQVTPADNFRGRFVIHLRITTVNTDACLEPQRLTPRLDDILTMTLTSSGYFEIIFVTSGHPPLIKTTFQKFGIETYLRFSIKSTQTWYWACSITFVLSSLV